MKQISSLELYFLVKELKTLENSRVDRIYNSGKGEIYIKLHKSSFGKKILRIIVSKVMFLTDTKSVDEKPSGFTLLLRKHLEGKFLDSIEQLGPERILKLVFKSNFELKQLYLEFFGKGNVILCDNNNVITDCLIRHKFKDRSIIPKQKYQHPKMEYNIFHLAKSNIPDLFKKSKKDKIVTSLAIELGLGGIYSEEVCMLSNLDKNTNPKKISNNEIIKLLNSINKIIKTKVNAQIIYMNKEALDVIPIDLESYKHYDNEKYPNYNEALNKYVTQEIKLAKDETSPYQQKINELKRIITKQEDTLKNLKEKEKESRKKAELVYNNYQLIKGVLDEINKATKKYSWKEIKDKLKGHHVVKDVDVKEKKIVVDTG